MPNKVTDQFGNDYTSSHGSGPDRIIGQYGKDQFGNTYTHKGSRGSDSVVDQFGNTFTRDKGGSFLDGILILILLAVFILSWKLIVLCIRRPKVGLPLTAAIGLAIYSLYVGLIPPQVRAERQALLGRSLGLISQATYDATATARYAYDYGEDKRPLHNALEGLLDGADPARKFLFTSEYITVMQSTLAEYASLRPGMTEALAMQQAVFYGNLARDLIREMKTQAPFDVNLQSTSPVPGVREDVFGEGEILLYALGLQYNQPLYDITEYDFVSGEAVQDARLGYAQFESVTIKLPRDLTAKVMERISAYFPSE